MDLVLPPDNDKDNGNATAVVGIQRFNVQYMGGGGGEGLLGCDSDFACLLGSFPGSSITVVPFCVPSYMADHEHSGYVPRFPARIMEED